ncbi:MAG TPA: LPS export ABC transporter periplasmic protein LptC [Candidatus Polarisedimenticolia bacterium]|nr:LPS export ABC transporter periplasmic protein LptC [Candidatus Polarisedimenticolia bacterium]
MERPTLRIARGPSRVVRALRMLILLALAGVVVGTAFTWGRRGPRQAAITMQEPGAGLANVTEQSERFSASGTREGKPAFELLAATVTGLVGEKKLLSSVQLDVHEVDGKTVNVLGKEGEFDPGSRRAQLRGEVGIKTPDGLSLETPNLAYDSDRDMIHTSDPIKFRLGNVEGSGTGLNYLVGERRLKIPARVRLQIQMDDGGPPVLITSGSLVASLAENSAVFTETVRLEHGEDFLTGNYLRIDLDAAREHVSAMRAFGEVSVAMAPDATGRPGSLQADSLVLSIGPANVLEQAEASGGCRFASGVYTSTSRNALYRKSDDRLELRGDPSVVTDRDRVAAQEIDLFPARQALEARGEVRTTTLGGRSADTPGFGSGDAVSFQAAKLLVEQQTGRATYSGSARAWQDGVSLQADEIQIDQAAKQIRGTGAVVSRFTPKPTAKTPRPATTSIAARKLVIDDATGTARYEGDTRLARPDASLTSDTMDVTLKESGKRREIDRIVAKGAVSARHEGSYATASEAEYLAEQQLLVLRDAQGLAEVVDGATGRAMRGRELTYDLAGNRVSTEAGPGGRTWITVTPDATTKGPARVEPPSRH